MATFGTSSPLMVQRDPSLNRRYLMADLLARQGADTSPVQHPVQGLGRLAQALAGAYIGKSLDQEAKGRETAYTDTMAKALGAAQPQSDDFVGPPQSGDMRRQAMIQALTGNKDTAPLAMQMQLQGFEREGKLEDAMALKRLEAPKTRTVKRGGIEVTEEFDPAARTWREIGQSGIGLVSDEAEAQKRRIAASGRPTNIGTIPPGYQMEEAGNGTYRMVPIPGGPAAREIDEKEAKAKVKAESRTTYANVVTEDVDRTIGLIEKADIPVTGIGSIVKSVPGTPAHNVSKLIDTIKANASFDKLQAMREASPTGGALGQVSDFENRLLQTTLGNLEQSQTKEQLVYNLRRVKETFLDIIHGPGNRPGVTDKKDDPLGIR